MAVPGYPYPYTTTPHLTSPASGWVSVTTVAGVFANSPWVEIDPATSTAWLISGISVTANSAGLAETEVDIGVGPDDANTLVVATFPHYQNTFRSVIPLTVLGDWIPARSRVVMRVRTNDAFFTHVFDLALTYYAKPYVGRAPISGTPLLLYPRSGTSSPFGTRVTTTTTPWLAGAWVEVLPSLPTDWIVQGVCIRPNFHIGVQPVAMEIELGIGTDGHEVTATTFRWSSATLNLCGTLIPNAWPLLRLPVGSRVAARARTADTAAFTIDLRWMYRPSATGLGDYLTDQAQTWFPAAADSLAMVTPGGAWTNSPVVELEPSLATDIMVTGVCVDHAPTPGDGQTELDLLTGADGVETVISTVRCGNTQAGNDGRDHAVLPLVQPYWLAAGTRLSMQARTQTATAETITAAVGYIASPTNVLQSRAVQYTSALASNGTSLVSGAGAWDTTDWEEVDPSLSEDWLVTGVTTDNPVSSELVVELGTGTLGNEVVATGIRCWSTNLTLLWFPAPVPHYLAMGTRLSIRFRQEVALARTRLLAVTYLAVLARRQPPINPPGPLIPVIPGTTVSWRVHRVDAQPRAEQGQANAS